MGVKVVIYGSDGPRYEPQSNVCNVDLAPFAVASQITGGSIVTTGRRKACSLVAETDLQKTLS
jgi:hypothetical protein